MMRVRWWLGVGLSLASAFSSCQIATSPPEKVDKPTTSRSAAAVGVAVQSQPARLDVFALRTVATGLLRAPAQSRLNFRISGTIDRIDIHNGATVATGQVLARLDDRDQRMALRLAIDQETEARAQLRGLIAEFGGEALDTNSLKPNPRAFVLSKSGYYRAQTAVAQARLQLDYTLLRAPYAGTVANLTAKPYNFITSFEPFCLLISRGRLLVEFSVLENEVANVRVGQPVQVLPVALPARHYNGSVAEINPLVNQQGLVLVKARLDEPDARLFEGMNVRVLLEQRMPRQLIVPKSAVVERSGRKVVFTVEGGLAKWHYVTVLHENDQEVVIGEGLKPGEQVIVSGNLNLAHDAPVTTQRP